MKYLPKDVVELGKWLECFTKSLSEVGHEIGISKTEVAYINTLTKIVSAGIMRYQLNINKI